MQWFHKPESLEALVYKIQQKGPQQALERESHYTALLSAANLSLSPAAFF